jgi:molybdopterin converting factor small subunit
MVVEVKMGDPLWRAVGQKRVSLELSDGATVTDALAQLGSIYPDFGAGLEAGGARMGIPFNFFVNRKLVKDRDLAKRKLKSGDTLYILAPIVGGERRG